MTTGTGSHVVLIGLPGVGKTTIGKALAKHLGRPFYDLDQEIERSVGCSVAQYFARAGEPAFRAAEVVVSQRLAGNVSVPAVLSPGGGWSANQDAVAHLRPVSRIIYLRVAPTEALQRLGAGIKRRPLFAEGTPSETMNRLFTVRAPLYEAIADETIDTGGAGFDEVLHRVLNVVLAYPGTLSE